MYIMEYKQQSHYYSELRDPEKRDASVFARRT